MPCDISGSFANNADLNVMPGHAGNTTSIDQIRVRIVQFANITDNEVHVVLSRPQHINSRSWSETKHKFQTVSPETINSRQVPTTVLSRSSNAVQTFLYNDSTIKQNWLISWQDDIISIYHFSSWDPAKSLENPFWIIIPVKIIFRGKK